MDLTAIPQALRWVKEIGTKGRDEKKLQVGRREKDKERQEKEWGNSVFLVLKTFCCPCRL